MIFGSAKEKKKKKKMRKRRLSSNYYGADSGEATFDDFLPAKKKRKKVAGSKKLKQPKISSFFRIVKKERTLIREKQIYLNSDVYDCKILQVSTREFLVVISRGMLNYIWRVNDGSVERLLKRSKKMFELMTTTSVVLLFEEALEGEYTMEQFFVEEKLLREYGATYTQKLRTLGAKLSRHYPTPLTHAQLTNVCTKEPVNKGELSSEVLFISIRMCYKYFRDVYLYIVFETITYFDYDDINEILMNYPHIMRHVLTFLPVKMLFRDIALVCREFNSITQGLYEGLAARDWGQKMKEEKEKDSKTPWKQRYIEWFVASEKKRKKKKKKK